MKQKKSKLVQIKTRETTASVEDFINAVPDEQKRKDSFVLLEMMRRASGEQPKMWGSALIGFGNRIYTSPNTGRQVEWMLIGFSPRKASLTLYLSAELYNHSPNLKNLGKHKTGGGCLYINKLADVNLKVLKVIIEEALKEKINL